MVSIKINGQQAEIGFDENPENLAIDLSTAINGIYSGLHSKSPAMAKTFKQALMICLGDDSPTWECRRNMTMIIVPDRKGQGNGNQ